jgi:hypothetical protein
MLQQRSPKSVSDNTKGWASEGDVKDVLEGKGRSAARNGSRSRGATIPCPPKA